MQSQGDVTCQYVQRHNSIYRYRCFSPFHQNRKAASIKLADGTCIGFVSGMDDSTSLAYVFIDINGSDSKPNLQGRDFFRFVLLPDSRLVPYGYELSYDVINQNCKNKREYGAAKIIADGWRIKSDYLW